MELNRILQSALNPPSKDKRERAFGEAIFREGDRVMQVRNNYDMVWKRQRPDGLPPESGTGIYNGDIGYIRAVDAEKEAVQIDFDGRVAECGFDQLAELEHAWAMTVHKKPRAADNRAVVAGAGARRAAAMTAVCSTPPSPVRRELLIAVGREDTALQMIDDHRQSRRYSGLRARLAAGA